MSIYDINYGTGDLLLLARKTNSLNVAFLAVEEVTDQMFLDWRTVDGKKVWRCSFGSAMSGNGENVVEAVCDGVEQWHLMREELGVS